MLKYTPKSLVTIKWLFIIGYAIAQKLNGIKYKLLTKSRNIDNKTKLKR